MNARYYLPGLSRFASPDTLVPDPANPQAFNRYAYVLNSPLASTDPTGHYACHTASSGTVFCTDFDEEPLSPRHPYRSSLLRFVGKGWTTAEQQQAHLAAAKLGGRLAATINASRLASSRAEPSLSFVSNSAAFQSALGGRVTLYRHSEGVICPYGHECRAWVGGGLPLVNLESGFNLSSHLLIHELFHIFDNVLGGAGGQAIHAAQTMPGSSFPDRPDLDGTAYDRRRWGFAGGNFSDWQKSRLGAPGEEFADMGIGWTYDRWEVDADGLTDAALYRANFMNVNMAIWLEQLLAQHP